MLLEGELYYRMIDGVLLRYLDKEEAKVLMGEIHEGVCGSHQSAYMSVKMTSYESITKNAANC